MQTNFIGINKVPTFTQTKARQRVTPELKEQHLKKLINNLVQAIAAENSAEPATESRQQYLQACLLATKVVQEGKNKAGNLNLNTLNEADRTLTDEGARQLFARLISSNEDENEESSLANSLDIICTHRNTLPLLKDKKINFNFFTNQPNFTDHALAFKEWITKQLSASSNLPVDDSIRDLAPAEVAQVEPNTYQVIEPAREITTEIEPSSASFSNKHKKIGEELAKSTESSIRTNEVEPESSTLVSQEASNLTMPNPQEVRQRLAELMEELDKLVALDWDNLELADELFLLIDSNYHALGTEEANAKIVQLIEKYSQVTKNGLFYVRGALELLDGYAKNLDRDIFRNLVINLINNYILSKESKSSGEVTKLLLDQAPLLADNYEDLVIRFIELHISLSEYNLAWDAEYGMELLNIFKPSLNRDGYANVLIKSIENFSQTDSRLAIKRQTGQELVEDTLEHMPHADKAEALLTTERESLLSLEPSPYNRLVIELVQNCSKLNDWESNIHHAKIARKVLLENKNQLPDSTYKQLVIGLLKNCVKKNNNYMYNEYIAQQILDENQDWLTSETYNEAYKEYVTEFFINSTNHKHLSSLLTRHGDAISVEEISKKYALAKKEENSSNKKIIQAIETYTNQEGQSRQIRLEDLGETA
jgi:hypothetical protein